MGSSTHLRFSPFRHSAAASWPSSQARPEDIFIIWLLQLPMEADLAAAASAEIVRIDREAQPHSPTVTRLREFLVEVTKSG